MARTKQAARKTTGGKCPKKSARASGNQSNQAQQSQASQVGPAVQQPAEEHVDLNIFSINFEDQEECEKNAKKQEIVYCQSCRAILNSQSQLLTKNQVSEFLGKLKHKSQEQEVPSHPKDSDKIAEQQAADENSSQDKNAKPSQQIAQGQAEIPDEKKQQLIDLLQKNDDLIWLCEFCLTQNPIDKKVQIPTQDNMCYILDEEKGKGEEEKVSENQKEKLDAGQSKNGEGVNIIFCIDISGSMNCSVERKEPDQNTKYVTRIECVQEAIIDELSKMKQSREKYNVGLVTFSDSIQLLGDCGQESILIQDMESMKNFDTLINEGAKHYKEIMQQNIQKSFQNLKSEIKNIAVAGGTALGPGLTVAVSLAQQGKPGSKVILCTDGQANQGIGSLQGNEKQGEKFYDDMAVYAKERGVMISVLTIKGDTKCSIKNLGKLSNATGGMVNKIDPQLLGSEFTKVLQAKVIGAQTKIKIRLNRAMKFRNAEGPLLSDHGTFLEENIGNFTKETELAYEFDMKTPESVNETEPDFDLLLFNLEKLPMQIQVHYENPDKRRFLQVYTDFRIVTHNENEVFEDVDLPLFAMVAKKKVAKLVQQNCFMESKQQASEVLQFVTANFQQQSANLPIIAQLKQQIGLSMAVNDNKQAKSQKKDKAEPKAKPGSQKKRQKVQTQAHKHHSSKKLPPQQAQQSQIQTRSRSKIKSDSNSQSRSASRSRSNSSEDSDSQSLALCMSSDEEDRIIYQQLQNVQSAQNQMQQEPENQAKQK